MPKAYAVLGVFDSPDALLAAIPPVKAKQLGKVEAYTPYPIHGIDDVLGLRRSPLGGMVLVMGILGALTAFGFQYWISAIDYPIVTGGKPVDSWEAFIPIMFEVTVLFATFTAGLGMLLLLNRLPFFGHPILTAKAMRGITRDRYALAIEAPKGDLDVELAKAALGAAGATELEVLEVPDAAPILTYRFISRSLIAIALVCAVVGTGLHLLIKVFPTVRPMVNMQDQPRLDAQMESRFFKDGKGMRTPVAGTVARGHLPLGVKTEAESPALVNPLPTTPETFALGRKAYQHRCTACHGPTGNGLNALSAAYGAKPANLQAEQFRNLKDGQIFWVIRKGKNSMPDHAAALSETESWAVVHYVRALQRAQNARPEDLK